MFKNFCNMFLKKQLMFMVTAVVSLTSLAITAKSAKSAVLTLSNDNSIVAFDPNLSVNSANNGLILWTVDDVNQLFQNQFWYRIGSQDKESPINTLNLIHLDQSQPGDKQISATYAGSGFEIALDFTLDGDSQGSSRSNLFENIAIKNTSSDKLDLHLFNYTDFDLNDNGTQDTAKIGSNKAEQFNQFTWATEVIEPKATYYQVSPVSTILDALEDNTSTTLNDLPSLLSSGDNAYAFQWDFTLDPEKSFLIKNYKSLKSVPEPTIIPALVGLSSLMLLCCLRRWWFFRKKSKSEYSDHTFEVYY
ncbi:hypothetical protein [Nostoc sp. FACHB-888]|uniref:hypothetical protein n=1 Tax=Nostoc sp. FACHB-888 TaxID=2692842 RepID=UPI001682BFD0|nr:hypothetical protein [Nostoc sp. FACHB-888]MBD2247484.1 hypothetical protein [Nostoc sp. FACHB-888]